MQFQFEIVDSIFGKFFILDSTKGLHFILKNNDERVKNLSKKYKPTKGLFNKSIITYFKDCTLGNKPSNKLKIKFLNGNNLQKIVWKKLSKINYGKTISYSEFAKKTPYPKAIRAIATAVGKNPVSVIVPCHRVICKNGAIGGYAWGVKMKTALLDIECNGMADSTYRGGK